MRLLKIITTNYKSCPNNFTINLNTSNNNSTAIIGHNASGKTSTIELIHDCFKIVSDFHFQSNNYDYNDVKLTIYFSHNDTIYQYDTQLESHCLDSKVRFINQHLYYKEADTYKEYIPLYPLPEDTSIVFFVLKEMTTYALTYRNEHTYEKLFQALHAYPIPNSIFTKILHLFDTNINDLKMVDNLYYELTYKHQVLQLSEDQLTNLLSSGTSKGLLLYVYVTIALQHGFTLLVDDIENYLDQVHVQTILNAFEDKQGNTKQASLIFSTHYLSCYHFLGNTIHI